MSSTFADALRLARGLSLVLSAQSAELFGSLRRGDLLRAVVLPRVRPPPPAKPPEDPSPPSNDGDSNGQPSRTEPTAAGSTDRQTKGPTGQMSMHASSAGPPDAAAVDARLAAARATVAAATNAAVQSPLSVQSISDFTKEKPTTYQEQSQPTRRPITPVWTPRERAVPESPFSRVVAFGGLGAGLLAGAAAESARRMVGLSAPAADLPGTGVYSAFVSDANAERLAASLSRMRGAALKLGQMLSIQDDNVIPPPVLKALERVRQGADVMPERQLARVMARELGEDWREKIIRFNKQPIAAASIGQVHRGVIRDENGQEVDVVFKIQYPGVARSIKSDLNNLKRLVTVGNFVPDNFFLDEALAHAAEELARECDYTVEAESQARYRELVLASDALRDNFYVPKVYRSHSTRHVLVSEFVQGIAVDRIADQPQQLRNEVASNLLRLTLAELFVLAFQQSDPNWSNYLYDVDSGKVNLIDFGAARPYDETFLVRYLALIRACAARDREGVIDHSIRLGFLTGEESKDMMHAHVQASFAVGEPFQEQNRASGFDFTRNDIPARTAKFGKVMLQYRLTPPPKEAYSLHRRLSGAFLMSTRLGATINAAEMLEDTVRTLVAEGRISE